MSRRGKSRITDTPGTSLAKSFERVASGTDDDDAVRGQRPTRTRQALRRASCDDTRVSHPGQSVGDNVNGDRGTLQPMIPEKEVAFYTAPTQQQKTNRKRSLDNVSFSILLIWLFFHHALGIH